MYLHVIANLHDVFFLFLFLCVEHKGDIYQMLFLLLFHSIQMDGDQAI